MKNYLDEIEKKLKDNIKIESLEIVDNSFKHRKHKFFDSKKYHLKLNIKSFFLNSISRINAQKLVMKTLEKDLKTKIHAIEINIEQ
tara:strand:- start:7585 stop:7842 length:258 start_codon:yes stop_codon:yes gene_type:complete